MAVLLERQRVLGLILVNVVRDCTMYPMYTTAEMLGRSGGDGRTPSNAERDAYVRQSAV